MDDALQHINHSSRLRHSFSVEADPTLVTATRRAWEGSNPPHQHLCDNVWDLCQPNSTATDRLLQAVGPRDLCIIVAGSPCQQLTTIGAQGGALGLGGRDSRHFYAVPLIAERVQRARPHADVHVLLENAASMA
eukprot:6920583-Prorocentrum_lima.AAC.1